MHPRESDSERFVRKNREQETERIHELSEHSGGLGPGDIIQIARAEAEERQEAFDALERRYG